MFGRWVASLIISFGLFACTQRASESDNTIQMGLRVNLSALDPIQASNEATGEVVPNIFEGLLQYHYLKRPLTVIPRLAESLPEVSKDGLTHKFKIRSGITFHDSEAFPGGKGRAVTANDFIYSWKRLADPKSKSDGWWIFDGKIKGLNEWRDAIAKGTGKFEDPVEGLQAPDGRTLVIKLSRPYYQLNYVLTMPYASVVPKEAVDKYGEEFMNHPVGTGPFKFESWIRGNKVTLVKNPGWHGETYRPKETPATKSAAYSTMPAKPFPSWTNWFSTRRRKNSPAG
ncbi:MAG: hypothetical protein HC902_02125 [Calothrix sp. SM1_5_4]|nr:hypothetical protein [Calothrix sp. SM1_5_4]